MPEIIFQDEHLLLLFKPSGWFVHPPENPKYRRGLRRRTLVQWLGDVHGIKAFPAHRLDAATEGILIFGKDKKVTADLNLQFKNHETHKIYHAVVRGWMPEESGRISIPLESAVTNGPVECETNSGCLRRLNYRLRLERLFRLRATLCWKLIHAPGAGIRSGDI